MYTEMIDFDYDYIRLSGLDYPSKPNRNSMKHGNTRGKRCFRAKVKASRKQRILSKKSKKINR